MKQDWILKAWKKDKRTKTGERLVNTSVYTSDEQTMRAMVVVALTMNPDYRFEYCPATKTVFDSVAGDI